MDLKGKQVLVTGAAGFLGANLVERLSLQGAHVLALDHRDFHAPSAKCFKADILDSPSLLTELVSETEIVFHFAALSSAHMSQEFEYPFTTNVNLLLRVLEAAARSGPPKRIIFPSSSTVYGEGPPPWKEDSILAAPVNWYAASKATSELLCKHYSRYRNIETVSLRIFCGYGPGEQHKGKYASPPSLFIKEMISGRAPELWGNGTQERDLVYVDDIMESLILAATSSLDGETLNVGTGSSISFLDLVGQINELLGSNILPKFVHPLMSKYLLKTMADTSKTERILEFHPKTSLREGLTKTIASISDMNRVSPLSTPPQ
jgi:UDP-glucose 4-epimerase